MTLPSSNSPLTVSYLVDYIRSGCRKKQDWRVGTEHEKLAYNVADKTRITYEQTRTILEAFLERGWQPLTEQDRLVGAKRDGCSITLEPGGQLELSGAERCDIHEVQTETVQHLKEVNEIGNPMGIHFLNLGSDPVSPLETVPVMPKQRYLLMRDYLSHQGNLGPELMYQSCTIQVNIDFESEEDFVQKLRVGLALQPVATALFANSPFREGKPSGYLSWRAIQYADCDPDRTGTLPEAFDSNFSFERFVEFALDIPMYYVQQGESIVKADGHSFRDLLAGKCSAAPGKLATVEDWQAQLAAIFPEVRVKQYLEMRGADMGPVGMITALPAFWVGLLYDECSQAAALEMIKDWTAKERYHMFIQAPRTALKTKFRDCTLQDLAKRLLKLSREGLQRRGRGEEKFLNPLDEIAATGVTLADRLLQLYHGEWSGSVEPLFSNKYFV